MPAQLRDASGAEGSIFPIHRENGPLGVLHHAAIRGAVFQAKGVTDLVIDHLDESLDENRLRLIFLRAESAG